MNILAFIRFDLKVMMHTLIRDVIWIGSHYAEGNWLHSPIYFHFYAWKIKWDRKTNTYPSIMANVETECFYSKRITKLRLSLRDWCKQNDLYQKRHFCVKILLRGGEVPVRIFPILLCFNWNCHIYLYGEEISVILFSFTVLHNHF